MGGGGDWSAGSTERPNNVAARRGGGVTLPLPVT